MLGVSLTTGTAQADSPIISASGGQCKAYWDRSENAFYIADKDNHDSDWCYVDYSWSSSHSDKHRKSVPQDLDTKYHKRPVTIEGRTIYWHVCKERQDDPDICSEWRSDLT
ncbi:hypothetical protein [Streptomyces sp. NBC_01304]|uniref:hypothetical protein n=1 Tax=Streptomyces sp. NBC_01304 TaxID=2903818 RepID=UPI002E11B9F4|nr:hypothetical protein OG430_23820 [Streptomyces sp. NBC_01304]